MHRLVNNVAPTNAREKQRHLTVHTFPRSNKNIKRWVNPSWVTIASIGHHFVIYFPFTPNKSWIRPSVFGFASFPCPGWYLVVCVSYRYTYSYKKPHRNTVFSNTCSIKHLTLRPHPVKIGIICSTDYWLFTKLLHCLRVWFVVAVPFIGCAPKSREEFVISLVPVIIVVVLLLRLG